MPKKEENKSISAIRHAEYYNMIPEFDELYKQSKESKSFTNLMPLIVSDENIMLAYRNIKQNTGSNTPGTDGLTITDLGKLSKGQLVEGIRMRLTSARGYHPKAVRRVEIPKKSDPAKTRPLGIPCIWDRLVQQCIKQVLEPICEAKFHIYSFGFRPNRSVEHAIGRTYHTLQRTGLYYVVEFDIKGFFDNVDHPKLIRQIWAMGIHDKHLIYIIRQILKAPIKLADGTTIVPTKGTPQGGIISPLLANINLNELDQWLDSQWRNNPMMDNYSKALDKAGVPMLSSGYRGMRRRTKLKELQFVRYADDFRVFCRNKSDAYRIMYATEDWLQKRLKLQLSSEKTRVVNTKLKYMDFLGFKMKVHPKQKKFVVESHISDKQFQSQVSQFLEQVDKMAKASDVTKRHDEVIHYNSMVMGMHNYYRLATHISIDCGRLSRSVYRRLNSRLGHGKYGRLRKNVHIAQDSMISHYAKSKQLRWDADTGCPILPIGYVQCRNPMQKKLEENPFTPEGRQLLHDELRINHKLMAELSRSRTYGTSCEYVDNRISLFAMQQGKCAVTGAMFCNTDEIHCHHKKPTSIGGGDDFSNLVLVLEPVHKLIHATNADTIQQYLSILCLNKKQLQKVNELRLAVNNQTI